MSKLTAEQFAKMKSEPIEAWFCSDFIKGFAWDLLKQCEALEKEKIQLWEVGQSQERILAPLLAERDKLRSALVNAEELLDMGFGTVARVKIAEALR